MVEKIIVNPNEVRCLGNISLPKGISDYERYQSSLMEGSATIGGATFPIKSLVYNEYGFAFYMNQSVKQLTVSDDGGNIDGFSFDDGELVLSDTGGVVSTFEFDDTNKCLVIEYDG